MNHWDFVHDRGRDGKSIKCAEIKTRGWTRLKVGDKANRLEGSKNQMVGVSVQVGDQSRMKTR